MQIQSLVPNIVIYDPVYILNSFFFRDLLLFLLQYHCNLVICKYTISDVANKSCNLIFSRFLCLVLLPTVALLMYVNEFPYFANLICLGDCG